MRAGRGLGAVVSLQAALLASPLLLASVLPPRAPRLLGFVLTYGYWLVVAGLVASLLAFFPRFDGRLREVFTRAQSRFGAIADAPAAMPVFSALVFAAVLLTLPGWRRFGPAGGDEPKYLRIAASLASDLDADIAADDGLPADA